MNKALRVSTLRLVISAIKYREIQTGKDLTEGDLRVCFDVNHITLYEGAREALGAPPRAARRRSRRSRSATGA